MNSPVAITLTQHTVDRYMQYSGSKRAVRTITRLFNAADQGLPIGNNRFYHRGWIVVIKDGIVKTAYRPRTREQMDAIFAATHKL